MKDIVYLIALFLSIILLSMGVFLLFGLGWSCLSAGASLGIFCASVNIEKWLTIKYGGANVDP